MEAVLQVLQKYRGVTSQLRIVKETGLPKSAVSTILKVLEGQGIVARQKAGKEKLMRRLKKTM